MRRAIRPCARETTLENHAGPTKEGGAGMARLEPGKVHGEEGIEEAVGKDTEEKGADHAGGDR